MENNYEALCILFQAFLEKHNLIIKIQQHVSTMENNIISQALLGHMENSLYQFLETEIRKLPEGIILLESYQPHIVALADKQDVTKINMRIGLKPRTSLFNKTLVDYA